MAIKVKYIRKGKNIRDLETDENTQYSSLNLAKKASRKIQLDENGAIGRGVLEVIKK